MSVVHTILSPEGTHTPFTGGTDQQRLNQGAARGVTSYFESTASNWPATGAGDNRSCSISMQLDPDYAYVMTDCTAIIIKLSQPYIEVEATALVEFKVPSQSGSEYIYSNLVNQPARQDTIGHTAVGSIPAREYNSQYPIIDVASPAGMGFIGENLPSYMLYPFQNAGDNVTVSVVFSEGATEQTALTIRFAARFLQYDIDQAYDWRVQSPTLTR